MSSQDYDIILIESLSLQMSIGIYEHEKAAPQAVLVSVEAKTPPNTAYQNDDIQDALSYEDIVGDIKKLSEAKHYELVESYAEDIVAALFAYDAVDSVRVTVKKPDIFDDAKSVGITVCRNRK